MPDDLRLWVVDASTLIEVRRSGLPARRQVDVFSRLTRLVETGQLIFPPQVLEELERGDSEQADDRALAWGRSVRDRAERQPNLNTVRSVLARAPSLIDPASPRDQADPYVIALAIDAQSLGGVSILSNDRRDYQDGHGGFRKLSVASVAAIWHIPVEPLATFLIRFSITP